MCFVSLGRLPVLEKICNHSERELYSRLNACYIEAQERLMSRIRKTIKLKGKAVPLQAWRGQEVSRKLKFPDFMTTAQGGGKVFSLMYRPLLPLRNPPGTHLC